MSTLDEIKILVKAEVASAIADLDKLEKQTDQNKSKASKMMETFGKMRDVMQGPIAAFNMVSGAVKAVAGEIDKYAMAASDAEKAQAILQSTLEATGATSWTSAAKLNDYASAMEAITLFDDDAITGMQGILLGFRNITGVNFDRASTEILNMSQVMGMDLTSAAQSVGKALDSPITGMDSLSKQGFKFSASEKEVIKHLVETNHLADAQDIILKELSKTYGGAATAAANTAAGAYENMKKEIGEVTEAIGEAVLQSGSWKTLGDNIRGLADDIAGFNNVKSISEKVKELEALSKIRGFQSLGMSGQADAIKKIGLNADDVGVAIKALQDRINDNRAWNLPSDIKAWEEEAAQLGILKTRLQEIEEAKKKTDAPTVVAPEPVGPSKEEIKAQKEFNKELDDQVDILIKQIAAQREISDDEIAADKSVQDARIKKAKEWLDNNTDINERIIKETKDLDDANKESGKIARDEAQKTADQIKKNQEEIAQVVMSGLESVGEAFGTALVENSKDGWKAFGKAGLDAIAAVVKAFAAQYAALAVADLSTPVTWAKAAGEAAGAVGLYAAAGAIEAIPMANGGSGTVNKPTLFLAGEAGPESYAFGGANNKALGKTVINNFSFNGSPWAIKEAESMVVSAMAKANRGY